MASKSKRRRRVLGASCILAALIVGASSFAWFTSSDEVTNRLTASADYGVTIAEDFTPPENWIPGQTIDKNVGVVNTGNVDAFVRTWLEGEMRLVAKATSPYYFNTFDKNNLTAVTDKQLNDANLNYSVDVSGTYYLKELTDKNIQNPDAQSATSPDAYSEVKSVQAGGELAYCPATTDDTTNGYFYKFKTSNQAMSVTNSAGAIQHIAANTDYNVKIDSSAAADIVVSGTTITLKSLSAFRSIDSNTFVPVASGLYVFRRNADISSTASTDDAYQFSGYYYDATLNKYFALEYATSSVSDYVLPTTGVYTCTVASDGTYTFTPTDGKLALYTATREKIENTGLTWTRVKGVTKNGVTYTTADNGTTWKKGTTALTSAEVTAASLDIGTAVDMFQVKRTTGAGSNVLINIALANLGSGTGKAEYWTEIKDTDKTTTFYYNNDLEEGATTSKLVDSMTMDSSVTKEDYIAFDFDLNVLMDSIQVTVAENGNEGVDTVSPWSVATTATYSDASGTATTVTNGEIELITWS